MQAKPGDFRELKELMTRQTGDEKLARQRTLLFGLLWNLEAGETPEMLIDVIELLRFELSLRRAEGR